MNLYDVIKKPVITEKSMAQLEAGKYVFEVDTRAHKLLIKQAVEKLKKLSSRLQLIQKQSSCSLLKLNNLRRKYRGNSCL